MEGGKRSDYTVTDVYDSLSLKVKAWRDHVHTVAKLLITLHGNALGIRETNDASKY